MVALGIREPDYNWEGMLKWWSAHSDGSHTPLREEEDENFRESMAKRMEYAIPKIEDVVDQVHAFIALFNPDREDTEHIHERGCTPLFDSPELEALERLDPLIKYAEYVDVAEALHEISVLDLLLDTVLCYNFAYGVYNKHASVRAKAAEVVTAMVHNNPSSQQLVMELNGLKPLFYNFVSDPDVTARTKALAAISSLIRNNKPGITAFLVDNNGYEALRDALSLERVEFQREALNLIQYLLHENSSDCNIVTQLGFPRIMMHLTSSDDAQVREAALRGLLVLARDEEGGNSVKNDDKLKQVLLELIKGISAMAPADLGAAAREEIQLVDSLWNACYNEPSSLGEMGVLLVLPGGC